MSRFTNDVAALILRIAAGLIFIPHGWSKVAGDGGTAAFAFDIATNYHLPAILGHAAAWSELAGGALLIIGLLTRLDAFLLACTMFVAAFIVQLPDALYEVPPGAIKFFVAMRAIETPLALFAIGLAVLLTGGGRFSLDALLGTDERISAPFRRKKLAAVALLVVLGCTSATQSASDSYTFVFLRRPANAPQFDEAKSKEIQDGHMANMGRLATEGHLVAAGPFADDTSLRGIFVFRTASLADTSSWLATDPAIQAGRLGGDVHLVRLPAGSFTKTDPNAKFEPAHYAMLVIPQTTKRSAIAGAIADADRAGKLALGAEFADGGGVIILAQSVDEAKPIAAALGAEVHPWMTQKGVLKR